VAEVDSIPTISFTDVTNAVLDSVYVTSEIFANADTTFWVTAGSNSFHIGSLTSYEVGWDTAHVNDTIYIRMGSAIEYNTKETLTLTAGGATFEWNVTTKPDATNVIIKILPGN